MQPTYDFDYHMHTDFTDGKNSIEEMVKAANEKGLRNAAITEHIRLDSPWIEKYMDDVNSARENSDTKIILGFETKLLDLNGTLDMPESSIDDAELIICSLHRIPGIHPMEGELTISKLDPVKTPQAYMDALMAICGNDDVDIIGHPFDLLYEHKVPLPSEAQMHVLARYLSASGKAVEMNTRYKVPPPKFVNICMLYGVKFSVGSDAHDVLRVGDISWAKDALNAANVGEKNIWRCNGYG